MKNYKRITINHKHRWYDLKKHRLCKKPKAKLVKPKKKKGYTKLKTYEQHYEKQWRKMIKQKRKHYKPIKKDKFFHYKPEPGIKGKIIKIDTLDIVKMGGVGMAFEISKLKKKFLKIKKQSGSQVYIRFRGHAINRENKIEKDKKIDKDLTGDIGCKRSTVVDIGYQWLKEQINAFNWTVSPKARRKKANKERNIKSLKIDISYIELWSTEKKRKKSNVQKKRKTKKR